MTIPYTILMWCKKYCESLNEEAFMKLFATLKRGRKQFFSAPIHDQRLGMNKLENRRQISPLILIIIIIIIIITFISLLLLLLFF